MADRIKNYQQEADQITTLKAIRTDLGVTPSSYTPDATVVTKDRVVTFAQAEEELVVLSDIEKGVKQQVAEVDIAQKDISNIKALLQGHLYDYQTDSTEAYTKSVPAGAMPYAGIEQIGGKTVVWNQLVDSGTTSVSTISGHMYYTLIDGTASIVTSDGTAITIVDDTADMVCDLTLMFGSGNEPSTTAEFTAIFSATHYPYNAGTLLSAGVTSVESATTNLVNPADIEQGSINGGGNNASSTTICRSGYISVKPNTTYTLWCSGGKMSVVSEYTSSKSHILQTIISNSSPFVFTTQATTAYIRFNFSKSDPASESTPADIGDKAFAGEGNNVPYCKYFAPPYIYPIPTAIRNLEGYGWSAGTAYNYVDFERKVFVKIVGRVGLATLNWSYFGVYAEHNLFYSDSLSSIAHDDNYKIYTLCNKYISIANANANYMNDLEMRIRYSDGRLYVNDDAYTDADSFKASLTNVEMVYELATPIEVDISQYLTDDNLISVESSGGTLTFPNSNGDNYRLPVPSEETYMIDLQSAIGG